MQEPDATYLTTKEAATLLRRSPKTLANDRCNGIGLPYIKLGGSVLYARSDMEAALAAGRVEVAA